MEETTYTPTPEMLALVNKRKELRQERQNIRNHIEYLQKKVERTTGKIEMVQESMDELRMKENPDLNTLPGLEFDEGEDG
jgi:chromosome segregation ATPase